MQREITLVVDLTRDPTKDDLEAMGRDAAKAILDNSGTRARYAPRNIVASVRFTSHNWESRLYNGPGEHRDWAVTEAEIADWDEQDAEEDEDDW